MFNASDSVADSYYTAWLDNSDNYTGCIEFIPAAERYYSK